MSFEKLDNLRLQTTLNMSHLVRPYQGADMELRERECSIRMDPKVRIVQVSAKCFRVPSFGFGTSNSKLGKVKGVEHLLK